ncbi:M20 family metallopeptidase [Nonomuraea sp. LP-02]|uniref:M20 metallopeptidase family protein n=1 Tax=Nonomuraea sp. LP-02 TaxID=3097960 RepID=UPI002E3282FE|nr:M20 family metallopeptidase [Nonomuraea sp. LP-02]MED7928025.1 M20 family metallopeptidase [Nonomuraea sp. LP-02]
MREEAQRILPELVRLRREIHADPELGLRLPRTQQRVVAALQGLDLEITLGKELDSVVAVLRGGRPGPVVLLRADMDALPMRELTDLPYRARGEAMHACGHDVHVAGLVGAAMLLHGRREELAGDVVFMFQPGEEVADGAARMIAEGVFDAAGKRPVAAYGIHVVPGEYGVFSTRPGPLMAGCAELDVVVRGRGGHASAPHLTIDPVPAVAELVQALQTFVTRRFDVFDPVVLSTTQLRAGGAARNIISDEAGLGATIRMLSEAALDQLQAGLPELVKGVAAAHGCAADVDLRVLCPPTVNDPALAAGALTTLSAAFGDERVRVSPAPVMGSEDFSYVLREVPGVFVFLRATPREIDHETAAPNHSPHVVFDDAVLADQAVALASLAAGHLA